MGVGHVFLLLFGGQHKLGGNVPGQAAITSFFCPFFAIVIVVIVIVLMAISTPISTDEKAKDSNEFFTWLPLPWSVALSSSKRLPCFIVMDAFRPSRVVLASVTAGADDSSEPARAPALDGLVSATLAVSLAALPLATATALTCTLCCC